jgi:hypothetical protein
VWFHLYLPHFKLSVLHLFVTWHIDHYFLKCCSCLFFSPLFLDSHYTHVRTFCTPSYFCTFPLFLLSQTLVFPFNQSFSLPIFCSAVATKLFWGYHFSCIFAFLEFPLDSFKIHTYIHILTYIYLDSLVNLPIFLSIIWTCPLKNLNYVSGNSEQVMYKYFHCLFIN